MSALHPRSAFHKVGLILVASCISFNAGAANNASAQGMADRLQALEAELQALKQQIAAQQAAETEKDAEQQAVIEAIADEQASQSQKLSWAERSKIGGYGELHYNNLDGEGSAPDKNEIDFHRFVLFFNHTFTDRLRFVSELEVEHSLAGEGKNGEVEVEQAFIEYDINPQLTARGGLFLIPVGILNETHEPPTFYGVERNPIENNIIPTTWWAGGAGLTWRLAEGWTWDGAIHEGLATTAGKKFAVRSGRQKTSEANAKDLAFTSRLKWTALPGLELAGSYQYQSDITQDSSDKANGAHLYEAHAAFTRGRFGLRALYAMWDIKGSDVKDFGADRQEGFYIEPSWKVTQNVGLFTRYNVWDNQAGSGLAANDPGNTEKKQWDVGVNWWLHENVVVKADYQSQDNENGLDQNGFNLGVGYQF